MEHLVLWDRIVDLEKNNQGHQEDALRKPRRSVRCWPCSHSTRALVRNAGSQTPPQSPLSAGPAVTHAHFRVWETLARAVDYTVSSSTLENTYSYELAFDRKFRCFYEIRPAFQAQRHHFPHQNPLYRITKCTFFYKVSLNLIRIIEKRTPSISGWSSSSPTPRHFLSFCLDVRHTDLY